jgi:hypothetical protein
MAAICESGNSLTFMTEFLKISYLISPLLLGLLFHGLCMKFHWLHSLGFPIDHGRSFRTKRLFGNNKTYRGIVAVAMGTAIGFSIQTILHVSIEPRDLELLDYKIPSVSFIGLAMGAAAMLSELPNSFIKRQLDIAPGTAASGATGLVFYFIDQVDMLAGVWLVLGFVVPISVERILWSIVFLFVAHQAVTVIGYAIGMRATAR